jgi:mono/diheme cytochrome c family protein
MMRTMRSTSLLALGLGGLLAGCDYIAPGTPVVEHDLNPYALEANEVLETDTAAQAQLFGALEMLFGTPSAPGYMRTEEWIDDEHDPNRGDLELSEEEWERVVEDNRGRFAGSLAALEAGEFDRVAPPREALDLVADWRTGVLEPWNELREGVEHGDGSASELEAFVAGVQEEWPVYLEEYYPSLAESAELYRQQCLHCHGNSGGGDGPTAEFLDPRPRDYRRGVFKFTALGEKARPRRDDLYRILDEGVYTTAMPSFRRFSRAQLHGLVDYVRLLSIRGETEVLLALEYDEDEGGFPLETVQAVYQDVWALWDEAGEYVIAYDGEVPEATDELIARGRKSFEDKGSGNCASCHGLDGRGGGESAFERDADGHRVRVSDDWGNTISPRDLTRGVFRFGRRPIDIFRRIHAGINGTPMPAHAAMKDPDGNRLIPDEDIWALVHYVRSLSVREHHVDEPHDGDGHGDDPDADSDH